MSINALDPLSCTSRCLPRGRCSKKAAGHGHRHPAADPNPINHPRSQLGGYRKSTSFAPHRRRQHSSRLHGASTCALARLFCNPQQCPREAHQLNIQVAARKIAQHSATILWKQFEYPAFLYHEIYAFSQGPEQLCLQVLAHGWPGQQLQLPQN